MEKRKPTWEEEKWFWQWCEVKCLRCGKPILDETESIHKHCTCHSPQYPCLCLDHLKLYAIPILTQNKANVTLSFTNNGSVATIRYYWGEWKEVHSDPVLALFWVIWKVNHKEKE